MKRKSTNALGSKRLKQGTKFCALLRDKVTGIHNLWLIQQRGGRVLHRAVGPEYGRPLNIVDEIARSNDVILGASFVSVCDHDRIVVFDYTEKQTRASKSNTHVPGLSLAVTCPVPEDAQAQTMH